MGPNFISQELVKNITYVELKIKIKITKQNLHKTYSKSMKKTGATWWLYGPVGVKPVHEVLVRLSWYGDLLRVKITNGALNHS
jgi:hypothetical protein